MQRLLLAVLILIAAAPAAAAPLPQPAHPITRLAPNLHAPPVLTAAPEQISTCRQALSDPTVSVTPASASPWRQYRGQRLFSTEQSFSPPQSLLFVEDSATDSDSAGQAFGAIPARLAEVVARLRYRYEAGSTAAGDTLRVELYESDAPTLTGLIARRDLDVSALDDGTWREIEWAIFDQPTLARIQGRASAVFAVTTLNAANGVIQRVWVDDITLDLCVSGTIGGVVRRGSAPAPNARVLLVRSSSATSSVVAVATTAADGAYRFDGVPALPPGTSYRVWFINGSLGASRDDGRLGFWAGPLLSSFAEGADVNGLDLDVQDVPLATPAPFARTIATDAQPASFTWSPGTRAGGERYRFCIYDPQRALPLPGAPRPLELCGPLLDPARDELAATLSPASFAATPDFGFRYGHQYSWYVIVYDRDPTLNPAFQVGYSFYERAVTFVSAAPQLPAPGPALPPGDPAPAAATADWTLLIYVAADNVLGDPSRTPRASRPEGQLAGLQSLATAHPTVSLVSYVDGFGGGGATLCVYPPGAPPDCRSRAEPDSASPQDLAAFLTFGRARYPATRTALLIISPGNAAGELATDETAGGGVLTLQELSLAYAAGRQGGAALDLVIYQAPNLGSLEVLRATAPHARYLVASPDQVWQLSALGQLVPLLAGAARNDAALAARGAVAAYQAALDATYPGRAFSLVAYNLARVDVVARAADDLAFVTGEALDSSRADAVPLLDTARRDAQTYDSSGNGRHDQLATGGAPVAADEDALVDLRGLALGLRGTDGPNPCERSTVRTVCDEASDLLRLLDDPATSPVIAAVNRSGPGIAGATITFADPGNIGVFLPSPQRLGGQPALADAYLYGPENELPRDGDWAPMVRRYLQAGLGQGPGGVTAAPGGGGQHRPLPGGVLRTSVWLPLMAR